jgi:hypothetical protein
MKRGPTADRFDCWVRMGSKSRGEGEPLDRRLNVGHHVVGRFLSCGMEGAAQQTLPLRSVPRAGMIGGAME